MTMGRGFTGGYSGVGPIHGLWGGPFGILLLWGGGCYPDASQFGNWFSQGLGGDLGGWGLVSYPGNAAVWIRVGSDPLRCWKQELELVKGFQWKSGNSSPSS